MMNPWEEIRLSDYESHMGLDSVKQLQTINVMMRKQLEAYPVETAMILGVTSGNGLEYLIQGKYKKVYGIDINEEYLVATKERYSEFEHIFECRRLDVAVEWDTLPEVELVIANLFIEYVGYEVFKKAVLKSKAKYVSCIIQINTDEVAWVSDSPYIHVFDGLNEIHCQIESEALSKTMSEIGYVLLRVDEYPLPNGKKLVMMDFKR